MLRPATAFSPPPVKDGACAPGSRRLTYTERKQQDKLFPTSQPSGVSSSWGGGAGKAPSDISSGGSEAMCPGQAA